MIFPFILLNGVILDLYILADIVICNCFTIVLAIEMADGTIEIVVFTGEYMLMVVIISFEFIKLIEIIGLV